MSVYIDTVKIVDGNDENFSHHCYKNGKDFFLSTKFLQRFFAIKMSGRSIILDSKIKGVKNGLK